MKVYKGYRFGKDNALHVVVIDGEKTRPLYHIRLHSPAGFECGYEGSGPGDLALSILADHLGENPNWRELHTGFFDVPQDETELRPVRCWRMHQRFKRAVIAALPREGEWQITEGSVEQWVREHEQKNS